MYFCNIVAKMKKAQHTVKAKALFMLVCFFLVITPLQFLHDVISGHHMVAGNPVHQKSDLQFSVASPSCACFLLEAIAVFVPGAEMQPLSKLVHVQPFENIHINPASYSEPLHFSLRGPPTIS